MSRLALFLFFVVLLTLGVSGNTAVAQSSCEKALLDAENLYQSGQLYDISEKLLQCLQDGFNHQQKQSAYRLLALTYLNINQEENAKHALYQLLRLNPDYEILKEKDPVELYNLYTQFNVEPVFYTGIRAGFVLSTPLVLKQRTASSLEVSTDKTYHLDKGMEIGLDFAMPLRPWLLLEASPAYSSSSYRFGYSYYTDAFSEKPVVQKVSGTEVYHQLVLPVSLNLRIPHTKTGKPRFFYNVVAGVGASYLLASSYQNVSRLNQQIFSEEITADQVESTAYRRPVNVQAHIGLGVEYKYAGYFWGARLGASGNLFNSVGYATQHERYLNTMSTTFGWLDDDFVLLNAFCSIFVRKPLYKLL